MFFAVAYVEMRFCLKWKFKILSQQVVDDTNDMHKLSSATV